MFVMLNRLVVMFTLMVLLLLLTTIDTTHDIRWARLAVIGLIMVEAGLLLKQLFESNKTSEGVKGAAVSIFTMLTLGMSLEVAFMFIPRSHGIGHTLGAKLWFDAYWKPMNTMGYRDNEPDSTKGKAIFFIGDSFTAGHGLSDVEVRFSNVTAGLLKTNGLVSHAVNLGRNGMDTGQEFADMIRFIDKTGIEPKAIVLQYFGNDIDVSATQAGIQFQGFAPYEGIPGGVARIIQGSYLVNYLYWLTPRNDVDSYLDHLRAAYLSPIVMQYHLEDITAFKAFADSADIPLLVVLFPFMQDLELSEGIYMKRIRELLDQEGVHYMDVSEIVSDLSVVERMVNVNDGHASIGVNQRVGLAIFNHLSAINRKTDKLRGLSN